MNKNLLGGNRIKILLHLFAWVILLGLPLYFIKRWEIGNDFIWFYYINTLIVGIIFYSNYSFLVPKFFFNGPKLKYYLLVMILIVTFYFISDISNKMIIRYSSGTERSEQFNRPPEGLEKPLPPPGGRLNARPPFRDMHLLNYAYTSVLIVFFSLGLKVLERNSQIEKLQKEMEKEKLNSELALLKNQINPHFFFNTLNNIYSLISINQDDSQKAVLKLSKLMRYLLYESELGNTKLSNEIEFMNNYIELMKLRVNEKINLFVSFPEKYENINIPPLLFIPFIENAFKHGLSYREKSFIEVSILTGKDSITFKCANSLFKVKEDTENGHSGIGLENVSKRLNLLFPGKHNLKISRSDSTFEILLFINIS